MTAKPIRLRPVDTTNPCHQCGNYSVFAGTTVDGQWFVKCPDCGLSTGNHDNYEDAQLAWIALDLHPSNLPCTVALVMLICIFLLIALNILLKGLTS